MWQVETTELKSPAQGHRTCTLATVLGLETQGPPAGAQHPSVLAEVTHANNSPLPSPVAGQLRQKK